jgi:hypothetical protein
VTIRDFLPAPAENGIPHRPDAARENALRRFAQSLRESDPALCVLSPFAPGLHGEILDAPSLVIEDHGNIRLFEHSGDEAYSYRALLLAGDDDLVAIGVPRREAFEAYCRDWLDLGRPRVLVPSRSPGMNSLATRCREDVDFIAAASSHAEVHGGLNILPYMGNGSVWELAAKIAENCRAPVRMIAPPPRLTRRVNDKTWFARLLQTVLGQAALPPEHTAESLTGLCRHAAGLAAGYPRIVVKLPDSASAAGNLVLESRSIRDLSWDALHRLLHRRLRALGWDGAFPLQVAAWEQPLAGSPSAQLWIPLAGLGEPLVEALFEQHSTGKAGEFDGARPCRLEKDLQMRIEREAFEIGRVLQHLGYFGRCSLDAILLDNGNAGLQLHWIECNGRWGGVSLPLSLNRRLDRGSGRSAPFVVIEEAHQRLPPREFARVIHDLEPGLYRAGLRDAGAILLSPGRLLDGSGFEVMVRAPEIDEAMRTAAEIAGLLGKSVATGAWRG